ncbi:hypothetical protein ABH995_003489 [Bradyrhizobium yuanmingense]
MQPALEAAANRQQHEGQRQGDDDDLPLSGAADDAEAGGKESAGGAGEASNAKPGALVHDDAGAEKADAGEDALDDTAGGVDDPGRFGELQCEQNHARGGEPDDAERLQPDRLAVQVAVEADRAAGKRGRAEAQQDFGPIELGHGASTTSSAGGPSDRTPRSAACP